MDFYDIRQLEETNINRRLMSQATSLEIAKRSVQPITRPFGGDMVTAEDVKREMMLTRLSCTEIKPK